MLTNFGVRTTNIMNEILDSNPRANIYWHEYFVNIPNIEEAGTLESEKIYDLIYFARISKEKGVEDFIKLTGRLCKQYPNLKTVIIGGANESYIKKLKKLAIDNQCSSAIDFQGFLPTQNDVYHILKKSKICVLPTYNDIIPGTIIESMFRKIAVVSYETGGIPDINRDEENILLSKQGDLDSLLSNIQSLLDSSEKRIEMANRAYNYAVKRWSNVKAMHDIVNAYKNIIKDEINK